MFYGIVTHLLAAMVSASGGFLIASVMASHRIVALEDRLLLAEKSAQLPLTPGNNLLGELVGDPAKDSGLLFPQSRAVSPEPDYPEPLLASH